MFDLSAGLAAIAITFALVALLKIRALKREVAERMAAEQKYETSNALIGATLESTADGVLAVATDGRIVACNNRFKEMFAVTPEVLADADPLNRSNFFAKQHANPEEFLRRIREVYERPDTEAHDVQELADGRFIDVRSLPQRIRDKIVGRVWNFRDITEQKRTEAALIASEQYYRTIFENAGTAILIFDDDGHIALANTRFEKLIGCTKEEIEGKMTWDDFTLHDDLRRIDSFFRARRDPSVTTPGHLEFRVFDQRGNIRNMDVSIVAIPGTGKVVASLLDITERKRAEDALRSMSITDPLTGLYNRRGFVSIGQQHLQMADRTQSEFLLLFADIDNMKGINDAFGHKAGDNALMEFANLLRESFRSSDITARLGGDEFVVLGARTGDLNADNFGNRLMKNLNDLNARPERTYKIAVSIGVVGHDPTDPCSLTELVTRADGKMYEKKKKR